MISGPALPMLITNAGDIVRFGPNALSFNTHTGMNAIYGTRANVQKAEGYASMSASRRTPNTITAVDKTLHGFKRRILTQVYSDQGLKAIEGRILANIYDFTNLLGAAKDEPRLESKGANEWGQAKNMASMCDWLAFDIISDLCYGEDFDMLHSPKLRWFPSVVRNIAQRSVMVRYIRLLSTVSVASLTVFPEPSAAEVFQLQD